MPGQDGNDRLPPKAAINVGAIPKSNHGLNPKTHNFEDISSVDAVGGMKPIEPQGRRFGIADPLVLQGAAGSFNASSLLDPETIDYLKNVLPTLLDNTAAVKSQNQDTVFFLAEHLRSQYGWVNSPFFSAGSRIVVDEQGITVMFPQFPLSSVYYEGDRALIVGGTCKTQAQIVVQIINASTVHDGRGVVLPAVVMSDNGESHVRPMISNPDLLGSLPPQTDLSVYARKHIPGNAQLVGITPPHEYDFTANSDRPHMAELRFSINIQGMELTYDQGRLIGAKFDRIILLISQVLQT